MSKAKTQMIKLRDIVVPPNRMRQLRPEKVDEIAESIAARGQLQPIIVRPRGDTDYLLVGGLHRLEAVRKLGHEAIECRVLDGMDADQALLAEIDENLVRADLTPSERAAHHAKRKQLYLKLHPETEKGKAGGRPRKTSDKMSKVSTRGYAKAAAKKVGKTSRTVARDVSRGEKIDPQALADLAGTCLDTGTELDALAKIPAAEQRRLAEAAKRGEKVTAITAHTARHPAEPSHLAAMDEQERQQIIEHAVAGETVSAPKPERMSEESKTTSFGMSAYKLASGLAAVSTAGLQNKLNKVVQRRAGLPAKERRLLADALRAVAKRFEQIADKIDIDEPPEMAYTRQVREALRLAHENKLAPIDPKEVIRAANAEITETHVEAAGVVARAWGFVAKQLERLRSDRGPDAARG